MSLYKRTQSVTALRWSAAGGLHCRAAIVPASAGVAGRSNKANLASGDARPARAAQTKPIGRGCGCHPLLVQEGTYERNKRIVSLYKRTQSAAGWRLGPSTVGPGGVPLFRCSVRVRERHEQERDALATGGVRSNRGGSRERRQTKPIRRGRDDKRLWGKGLGDDGADCACEETKPISRPGRS